MVVCNLLVVSCVGGCSVLFVVCRVFVVCVGCPLFVVGWLLWFGVRCFGVRIVLCVVDCVLFVSCCVMCVVYVECRLLFVVCCRLRVVRCVLFDV